MIDRTGVLPYILHVSKCMRLYVGAPMHAFVCGYANACVLTYSTVLYSVFKKKKRSPPHVGVGGDVGLRLACGVVLRDWDVWGIVWD